MKTRHKLLIDRIVGLPISWALNLIGTASAVSCAGIIR